MSTRGSTATPRRYVATTARNSAPSIVVDASTGTEACWQPGSSHKHRPGDATSAAAWQGERTRIG